MTRSHSRSPRTLRPPGLVVAADGRPPPPGRANSIRPVSSTSGTLRLRGAPGLPYELRVLRRHVGRLCYRRRDWLLLAAASRLLPRPAWKAFSVTPETVVRWHRELVCRKWTFRCRGVPGRPPMGKDVRSLVVRADRETDRGGNQAGSVGEIDAQP